MLGARDRGDAGDVAHELLPGLKLNGDFGFGPEASSVKTILRRCQSDCRWNIIVKRDAYHPQSEKVGRPLEILYGLALDMSGAAAVIPADCAAAYRPVPAAFSGAAAGRYAPP
jgi:hypothetical protein